MDEGQTIFQQPIVTQQQNTQIPNQVFQQPQSNDQSFYAPETGGRSSGIKKFFKLFTTILALVILILIIVFFVVSNIKNNIDSSQVTLTYWGLFEDQNAMQSIISDFEKQNPNIRVDYSRQDISQYRERLTTRINSGTGPDIFRFHNTWYPMFSNILLPLPSDTISKGDFAKNYYPVMQKDLIKNGAIYGIPLEVDILSLFINNQLFQSAGLSAPSTWNDFINDARAITVKDANGKIKTAGAGIGTYDNVTHAPDLLSLLFLQNGADLKNLQASSDRIQGAINFYTSFATDQNNVWDNTLDPSILAFSKGNLGMFFGYSQDYFTIKQFNPSLNFQIVPVPQLPNQSITLASYWVEGVSSKSKHQKEALLFMKYLAQKETVEKLYAQELKQRAFGEPYARVDLANSLKGNQNAYTFVLQAPLAFSSPFVDSTSDNGLNQQLDTFLQTAINSVLANTSTQTAFDAFLQAVNQTFQKYPQ